VEAATCKKELLIEIPAEVVRREADTVTAQYAKAVHIPGFRPGHAPKSLVERRFREDIRGEVVQTLLPRFFEDVVKDQKLSVVGRPRFEDLKFEQDQPLTCKATFEVIPEIELKNYKGLEVEEETAAVGEAEVEKALEELREHAATFEVVTDRPAQDDDYLTVNYRGREAQAPGSRPLEAHEAIVHLGAAGTVAGFSENLRGVRVGEAREFQVTYPEDHPQKSLAGKTLSYRVEVQSIKRKVVPPADDDLAKSVSEYGTLAELRLKLQKDVTERAKRRAEGATRQKLVEALLASHDFPVPEVLVEAQLDRKLERTVAQLLAQGIDPRETEIDWRKIREEARPEAQKEVRTSLILAKIAEAEKLEPSEEEVDEMIRALAQERQEAPAALKTRLTRDGELDKIKSTRRNQKALDIVYREAKVTRKSE
jgi:trigger factor